MVVSCIVIVINKLNQGVVGWIHIRVFFTIFTWYQSYGSIDSTISRSRVSSKLGVSQIGDVAGLIFGCSLLIAGLIAGWNIFGGIRV